MYNNEYMYAIERSDEYLAHYGIRGMKWGVHRALTKKGPEMKRALDIQYAKAQKKLAKLEKRATKSKKYARRAALMGAGAAAAGGLAVAGTGGVGKGLRSIGRAGTGIVRGAGNAVGAIGRGMENTGLLARGTRNKHLRKIGAAVSSAGLGVQNAGRVVRGASGKVGSAMTGASHVVEDWGRSNSIAGKLKNAANSAMKSNPGATKKVTKLLEQNGHAGLATQTRKLNGVSNNTIARIGAGAVGAGLAVGAARNAYKAATAKKKAEKFRSAMNDTFKGTQYANGGKPRQGKKRRK